MGIVSQLGKENDDPEEIKTLKLFVVGKLRPLMVISSRRESPVHFDKLAF
jgi:hypothetical protein